MIEQTSYLILRNLAETSLAAALFLLLFLIPGFVFGWMSNIVAFRQRTPGMRLMLGSVFSIALCPILTYLIGRFTSFTFIWVFYATIWLIFLWLFLTCQGVRKSFLCVFSRSRRAYLVVVGIWLIVGTFALIDIRTPTGLYRSQSSFDHLKHTCVIDAITRTGLPPVNPSFHPGRDLPLCYYYFWHLMCSLVDRLGGDFISARSAAQAGTLWTGISLFSIILLYLRLMPPLGVRPDRRSEFIAVGLLLVTGFDLLPALTLNILNTFAPDRFSPLIAMEWWNEQVSSWSNIMIWVPQHLASLVACLAAFLVLRISLAGSLRMATPIAFAALAASSALGMSVWVILVACLTVACWIGYCVVKRWMNEVFVYGAVALVFLMISSPFLMDLHAAGRTTTSPVVLGLRPFPALELIAAHYHWSSAWATSLLRVVSLPLNYGFELGFFLLASVVYWKKRAREAQALAASERFLLVVALVSIVACTCLRSSLLHNDLGWRGFMFAQFVMLLWSIPIAQETFRSRTDGDRSIELSNPSRGGVGRVILLFSLCLGASTTLYDLAMQRVISSGEKGKVGLELAQAYEWIRDHTSPSQIYQHNPAQEAEFFHGLYVNRQVIMADQELGPLFAVDKSLSHAVTTEVGTIFKSPSAEAEALAIARRYSIDVLVFTRSDPLWQDPHAWIWTEPPVFQNDSARVFFVDRLVRKDEKASQGKKRPCSSPYRDPIYSGPGRCPERRARQMLSDFMDTCLREM